MKVRTHPQANLLKECGYTMDEEIALYDAQLQDIIDNPGKYLDGLDYMVTYRVRWKDYRYKTPTLPHKYTLYGDKEA